MTDADASCDCTSHVTSDKSSPFSNQEYITTIGYQPNYYIYTVVSLPLIKTFWASYYTAVTIFERQFSSTA